MFVSVRFASYVPHSPFVFPKSCISLGLCAMGEVEVATMTSPIISLIISAFQFCMYYVLGSWMSFYIPRWSRSHHCHGVQRSIVVRKSPVQHPEHARKTPGKLNGWLVTSDPTNWYMYSDICTVVFPRVISELWQVHSPQPDSTVGYTARLIDAMYIHRAGREVLHPSVRKKGRRWNSASRSVYDC